MELWLWGTIAILLIFILALLIKLHLLRKSAREIENRLALSIRENTNVLIDISGQDKYMKKLAAGLNLQLKELHRERHRFIQGDMELKDAVTNISHDLRTPLTAISGYLDLLESEEKSADADRYLRIIRQRTEILTQLTEELFRYSVFSSTSASLKRYPVDVKRLLEDSISAYYAALKQKSITPDITMPEKKVLRTLNSDALLRIFANILSNALKYSDGDLHISLNEQGEILFSNHASGLDEVQTKRLFDRFYTVETASKSTGLGLAIARHLTEEMQGTIAAEYIDGSLYIRLSFPEKA